MKKSIGIIQLLGVCCVTASCALQSTATDTSGLVVPSLDQPLKEIAPSELKIALPKPDVPQPKPKETAQPLVKPAPKESRTPEDASILRAADPKDPSAGAFIIKVPDVPAAKP